MATKPTVETDRSNAAEIERLLLYMGLYERHFGCPDPMFFDGALPGYKSIFTKLMHGSRDVDGRNKREIEGSMLCFADGDNQFELVGCRLMGYQARQNLLAVQKHRVKLGLTFTEHDGRDAAQADTVAKLVSCMTPLAPILEVRRVAIDHDGHARTAGTGYILKTEAYGGEWVEIASGGYINGEESLASFGFRLGVSVAATAKEQWFVKLQYSTDMPGIQFITDPTGIKDFFRFRDIPEGRSRRAALTNWVSQHWREHRDDPETEIYVREHLRGARQFSWHGFNVTINVPEADVVKHINAAERRKRMSPAEAMRRRRIRR